MARSARLYDQRRVTYEEIGVFLERERVRMERLMREIHKGTSLDEMTVGDLPSQPRTEEWTALLAHAAVRGSTAVQVTFAAFHERSLSFYQHFGVYMGMVL